MIALLIALLVLMVFEVVSVRFGADSRDGDDWAYQRHTHPGGGRRMPV